MNRLLDFVLTVAAAVWRARASLIELVGIAAIAVGSYYVRPWLPWVVVGVALVKLASQLEASE